MFDLGKLFDKEAATYDTVQGTLEAVAEELQLPHTDFFIMIRPMDAEFNHKYFICKYDSAGNPVKVREITLKEILE
jgi:hypothetical protein